MANDEDGDIDETVDEYPSAQLMIDMAALKEQIRQQEFKEASAAAELLAQEELQREVEATAVIAQQQALHAALEEAQRQREARLKADAELKALKGAQKRMADAPKLPPPTLPPVVADLNSARSLWEYIPPADSVRSQDATEAWRESQGTTPLHINSAGASAAAGPRWLPGQGTQPAARIQLIQGDLVWVSLDKKRTEQVRVGGRHSSLGLLKSIDGNTVNFERASLNYIP